MSDHFEPTTEEPVATEETVVTEEPVATELAESNPKKQNTLAATIVIAAVAVVVVFGILIACFLNGVFLSNRNKILVATKNTFEDTGLLFNDLNEAGAFIEDTYAISMEMNMEDLLSLDITSIVAPTQEQLYGDFIIPDYGTIDFVMGFEEE